MTELSKAQLKFHVMTAPIRLQDIDIKDIKEIIKDPIEASRVDTHPVDHTHPLLENLHTSPAREFAYTSLQPDEVYAIK